MTSPEELSQDQLNDMFPLPETYAWFQNKGVTHMTVYGIRRRKVGLTYTRLWFGWIRRVNEHGYADDVEPEIDRGWSVAFYDTEECEIFPTAQEAYQYIYNRFLFNLPEEFL